MALYKQSSDLLAERRILTGPDNKSIDNDHGLRAIRRRKLGRFSGRRLFLWVFSSATLVSILLAVSGLKIILHGESRVTTDTVSSVGEVRKVSTGESRVTTDTVSSLGEIRKVSTDKPKKTPRRPRFFPCKVGLLDSVDDLVEPKEFINFEDFSLQFVDREESSLNGSSYPRFGGHQTLEEREQSFFGKTQKIHCGFVKGPEGFPSTGFDLDKKDKEYMTTCVVVVSSCIFGSSDFLRKPTSKVISGYSKKNVCFVMFVDEQTLVKLKSEGSAPDDGGYFGLWRIVVVRNLPYEDMRKTGKVPKFLSHRLFPSSRYSVWLDSKLRLTSDPMLIIEYFLWRTRSVYAISNHYTRHCVWEEVLQNKRLNKYNHTAIDQQFNFYQSDGLTKFDPQDPNTPLPSYVPEGSFIIRAHTPMSNLFSCLWFNEVDRFTSRDQLSFGYTFLKLKRMNPHRGLMLNMFKDCERRSLAKLFHHRVISPL